MTASLRLIAPAKVNLGLRVLGRRPDGYHELRTVFHAIDLCDDLDVTWQDEAAGPSLSIQETGATGLPVAAGEENLVVRAARAIEDEVGLPLRARFTLRKRIPAGAGLGGGSSDAAAALRLGNRLLGDPLDDRVLLRLAVRLGADVPFFLLGDTCAGAGIGEELEPVEPAPRLSFVLVLPPFGTSTAAVFKTLSAALIDPSAVDSFRSIESARTAVWAAENPHDNDLEAAAMVCTPGLRPLRDALVEAGVSGVRMSGSGSTLFAAYGTRAEAEQTAESAERAIGDVFGARVLIASSSGPRPEIQAMPGGGS
ncbi:MAG: 4-(cytidine 5'-diphospho)-2-C-methyl-D-erythritol kinase [Planctomycetota bacterium]|nr:4-(cytidine 5'-diphospho)-2-C-methyl-D-erythritol kinase [Planctomycetota bacterium]